jgi:putative transposase
VPQTRHRRHLGHPGKPTSPLLAPNAIGSADGKGHFTTGAGLYGEPLPGAEGYRRFRRGGQARSSTRGPEATPVFTRVVKEVGLPKRLRTDHGGPCAPHPLARLVQLSAGWGRLGLLPECIAPGQPHHNGRHERRPRTRKAQTTRPPAATRRAHQHTFERCRPAFHVERPPDALEMPTPASRDEVAPREMPPKRPPLADPDRFEGRYGSAHGGSRWHPPWGNGSPGCLGADVGLEDIDAGVWTVSFGPLTLGRLLARHLRIEEADGRLIRRR